MDGDIGIMGVIWFSILLFILIIIYLFYFLLPVIIVFGIILYFWLKE